MSFIPGLSQYLTFNAFLLTNSLAADIKFQGKADEIDVSTIGNNWKAFLQGQVDATIAVSGVWDSGTAAAGNLDTTLMNNLNAGGTKLWEYLPAGSASGNIKYQGNGFLTAYEVGGAVKDRVGFSASIRNAGSVTKTTSS